MNKSPLISVLIPSYNCGRYIKQAVESVYAQNCADIEIIAVDDGSQDNTKEVLNQYPDVKYIYQNHQGISAARNNCLKNAKGAYIAFLDADDYWTDGKLKDQLRYFDNHPECMIVFTAFENFTENEGLKTSKMVRDEIDFGKTFKFPIQSALIKKEVFEKYGCFMTELPIKEDTEFFYRLQFNGVDLNHFIDKVYCRRRLHEKNSTLTVNFPMKSFLPFVVKYLRKNIMKG